jgi:hypothetical protein
MRILDEDNDKSLDRVTLYLTNSEASELRDALETLLTDSSNRHEHIPDAEYKKELTVCIYDQNILNQFNERSKKIITKDE